MTLATTSTNLVRSALPSWDRTLVIFDRHLADLELLYNALVPNAIAFALDNSTEAIPAITQILSDTGATSLAIVAHGAAGKIDLGTGQIDLDTLNRHAGLLQEWGVSEIALYSCEVGTDGGFISRWAELTGANIAAATGKVGCAALGGKWELDIRDGKFSADIFVAEQVRRYSGVLARVTGVATPSDDGAIGAGESIEYVIYFDETVFITGSPILRLSNGQTATYRGGSSGDALYFTYTAGLLPTENIADLALADDAFDLSGGATIQDGLGNNADLTGANSFDETGILVVDNIKPSEIEFSATSINENNPVNAVVATLSSTDVNPITYSLAGYGYGDESNFSIDGDRLRISRSANFEVKRNYNITVRATDTAGNFTDSQRSIAVNNINDAPTGFVTIAGIENLDRTLTASNNLADEDGLGEIVYQWQADGVDIKNAVGETFTLTPAQLNRKISVKASYTDDLATPESVVSPATNTVVIERFGNAFLSLDSNGEYVANNYSTKVNLTYAGSKVSPTSYPGWQVVGVNVVGDEVQQMWKSDSGQYWYNTNTDNGGLISGGRLFAKEMEFQQDFDGDNAIGKTPTNIESFGNSSLATDSVGEYVTVFGSQIKLTYDGSNISPTTFAGWQVIGVQVESYKFEIQQMWKSDGGLFWYSTNTDNGGIISGKDLLAKEIEFKQDFDGDGVIIYPVTTGDDTYTFDANTYQNSGVINEAVDGGNDTIFFISSEDNYVDIDLSRNIVKTKYYGNLIVNVVNVENIFASSGDDFLIGDRQNNTLTGGSGRDTFGFGGAITQLADLGVDTITDFSVSRDKIELSRAIFGDLTPNGEEVISASQFSTVTINPTGSTGIVYNISNGKLFYNDTEFAQLSIGLGLTNDNFRQPLPIYNRPIW